MNKKMNNKICKKKDLVNIQECKNTSPIIIGEYSYNCLGFNMLLPVIKSLNDIPQNMYYYYGDKKNKRGIYCRISSDVIIKIPMVETIPENIENSRQMIVKCNRGDKCTFWNCTYAHPGVPYNKIGYIRRCPSCPSFSNYESLKTDIKFINYEDIRICIMYSITDLFAVNVWCQDQNKQHDSDKKEKMIWNNLDICGTYKNPYINEQENEELWDNMS